MDGSDMRVGDKKKWQHVIWLAASSTRMSLWCRSPRKTHIIVFTLTALQVRGSFLSPYQTIPWVGPWWIPTRGLCSKLIRLVDCELQPVTAFGRAVTFVEQMVTLGWLTGMVPWRRTKLRPSWIVLGCEVDETMHTYLEGLKQSMNAMPKQHNYWMVWKPQDLPECHLVSWPKENKNCPYSK